MESNKLYNIDCLEGLKQLKDNYVQLVVTSPPYNMNDKRYYKNYEDNKSSQEYIRWLNEINKEVYRVLKDDGVYCLNMSYNKNSKFEYIKVINNCLDNGFVLTETVSWLKKGFPITEKRNFTRDFEFVFILTKSDKYKTNQKVNEIISNVWKIGNNKTQSNNTSKKFENSLNNATFPIKLPIKCIDIFTEKDDVVLDIFMGSGTTAVACKQKNIKYIGFELDKETFDFSFERLNKNKGELDSNWF